MSHYDCVGDGIGPILFHRYRLSTHDTPPPVLITFYRGIAALIRARIAILHLLEPSVRKWSMRAAEYLEIATRAAHILTGDPRALMSKRRAICVGWAAIHSIALALGSHVSADPIAGQNLADKWCVECQGVRDGRLSPNLGAPTFLELSAEPSLTVHSLRALLRSPHETMPHIIFTPDQMDDIIDYIMLLKPRH